MTADARLNGGSPSAGGKIFRRSALRQLGMAAVLGPGGLAWAGSASARDTPSSDAGRVASALDAFQANWDSKAWSPARGRYMRPSDDPGWKHRMAALQSAARHGAGGADPLIEALQNEATHVRALAAQALGYSNAVAAKPALARLVEHDPDAMVRLYAADSLGMLGGRDHDALFRKLQAVETNRDTRRHFLYALQRKGQPVDAAVIRQLREWDADGMATARLGQPAPDFELASLDGETARLSQFRGRRSVILVFVYGDT